MGKIFKFSKITEIDRTFIGSGNNPDNNNKKSFISTPGPKKGVQNLISK